MESFKIISGAAYLAFEKRATLLKHLSVPAIAYIVLQQLITPDTSEMGTAGIYLLSGLLQVFVSILTHRVILLGDNPESTMGPGQLIRKAGSFVYYQIGLVMLIVVLVLLPGFIAGPLMYAGMLLALYIVSRCSLIFPAVAIDDDFEFKDSWTVTAQYKMLMVLIVIFFPAALAMASVLLSFIPFTGILSAALDIITTVLTVTALSLVYQHIKQEFLAQRSLEPAIAD
ncbi:hypothetical protein ACWJJH_03930 [Endozoicomonadaceae bacterium StTr2]